MGNSAAIQNSILNWASGHRTHHRFVDDVDKDPYSAKRGFWFSHMGWMLRNYPSSHLITVTHLIY
jgi:stearoyl-CoA desaturase (delta-9 desaturase)